MDLPGLLWRSLIEINSAQALQHITHHLFADFVIRLEHFKNTQGLFDKAGKTFELDIHKNLL
jgi:hypothetical protein